MARVKQSQMQAEAKEQPENKEEAVKQDKLYGTVKLTSDLKKRALEWVMSRYRAVYNDWKNLNDKYDQYDKQYWGEGGVDRRFQSDINVLFAPETFKHTEGWTNIIMDMLFSVSPPVKPKIKSQDIGNRDAEQLKADSADLMWHIQREQKYRQRVERIVRQGCRLGTFAYKLLWDMTEKEEYEKTYVENEGWVDDYYSTPRDMPVIGFVDLRNLIFRLDTDSPQWVIERILTQWWKLENQAKQYNRYADVDKAKKNTRLPRENDDPTKEQKERLDIDSSNSKTSDLDQDVEVFEYHGLFDYDNDGALLPCTISIANRAEVIGVKVEDDKRFPYRFTPFIPMEGTVIGKGIPELVRTLQGELNDVVAQGMDNRTMMLCATVAYNEMFIKNKDDLNYRPQGTIRIKGNKNVQEVLQYHVPPDFSGTVEKSIERIKRDIADLTKMRDPSFGIQTSPKATATEVSTIMQSVGKEVALIIRRIEEGVIEESFNAFFEMMMKNIDRAWWVDSLQDPGVYRMITPDMIYANVVWEAQGVSYMENTAVAIKSAQNTLALLQQYAEKPIRKEDGTEVLVNEYAAIEDVLRAEGKKDIDKYFIPASPPPPPPPAPPMLPEATMPNPMGGGPGAGNILQQTVPTMGGEMAGAMAPPPGAQMVGL